MISAGCIKLWFKAQKGREYCLGLSVSNHSLVMRAHLFLSAFNLQPQTSFYFCFSMDSLQQSSKASPSSFPQTIHLPILIFYHHLLCKQHYNHGGSFLFLQEINLTWTSKLYNLKSPETHWCKLKMHCHQSEAVSIVKFDHICACSWQGTLINPCCLILGLSS